MFGMMAASTKADVGEVLGLSSGWKESRGKNVSVVLLAGAGGARVEAEHGSFLEVELEVSVD